MERQFTEQEVQEIYRAEPELRKLGLIIQEADADSLADVEHNTNLIFDYYNSNLGIPVTVQTMVQVAKHLRDKLKWMSAPQIAYISSYEQGLSDEQKNKFGQFWGMSSTKRALIQTGDAGFKNCVALIEFARGRDFSIETFNLAMGNLTNQGKLHLAPVQQSKLQGHTMEPGESFMPKENNTQYRGGKLNHAYQDPNKKPETVVDTTPDAWDRVIEGQLRNGTHGEQAAARELFEQLSAQGFQPRQISGELSKLQRSYQRLIPRNAA